MARTKVTSAALEKAERRLAGMKSIDAELDLGEGVTVASVATERAATKTLQERYNALAIELGTVNDQLKAAERGLNVLSSKVLSLVRVKFGPDSTQYEAVGGVRTSERKRTPRRSAGTPPA